MKKRLLIAGIFVAAAAVAISSRVDTQAATLAPAADPNDGITVSTMLNSTSGTHLLNVKVCLPPGAGKMRDLHVYPLPGRKLPKPRGTRPTAVPTVGGNQGKKQKGWKLKVDKRGWHLTDSTAKGGLAGPTTGTTPNYLDFTLVLPTAGDGDKPANWFVTSNGKAKYKPTDVLNHSGPKSRATRFPTIAMAVNRNRGPIIARLGDVTEILAQTSPGFVGLDYEIVTARTLNTNFDDPEELGLNADTDPVPSSWGVEFDHHTGTLGEDGMPTAAPTVDLSRARAIEDDEFYLVFVVRDADGCAVVASDPTLVSIANG